MKVKIGCTVNTKGLERLPEVAREVLGDRIEAAAKHIEALAKMAIQQSPASGRIYVRVGRTHQASGPGEAPATDLGMLANSILTKRQSQLCSAVLVFADYAIYLELGTVHMAARPYLYPAFDAAIKSLQEQLGDTVRIIVKRVSI
jgi:hypothetical protein